MTRPGPGRSGALARPWPSPRKSFRRPWPQPGRPWCRHQLAPLRGQGPGSPAPAPIRAPGEWRRPYPPPGISRVLQLQGLKGAAQPLAQGLQPGQGPLRLERPRRCVSCGPGSDRLAVAARHQAQGPAGVHLPLVALAAAIQEGGARPAAALDGGGHGPGHGQLGGAVGRHGPLGSVRFEGDVGGLPPQGERNAGLLQPRFRPFGCLIHPVHRGQSGSQGRCGVGLMPALMFRSAR